MHQKMSGLTSGALIKKERLAAGFTLFEIVVVLAIIGIFFGIILSQFTWHPKDERPVFIDRLNLILRQATRHATETNTFHRVVFNFEQKRLYTDQAPKPGPMYPLTAELFAPTPGFVGGDTAIPPSIIVTKLMVEGRDEVSRGTQQTWFFIDPNGNSQEVAMVLAPEEGGDGQRFILNPFTRQFEPQ